MSQTNKPRERHPCLWVRHKAHSNAQLANGFDYACPPGTLLEAPGSHNHFPHMDSLDRSPFVHLHRSLRKALAGHKGLRLGGNKAAASLKPSWETEKRPFLIATRAYSREKLIHRKHRLIRFSNRHKIHFVCAPVLPSCHRARIRYNRANSETKESS